MTRRLTPLALLFVAASLAGCGSQANPDKPAPTKVTVVLDWTPNTNHSGVYLAKQDGLYAKAGLDVEIIEPGQDGGLAPLAAGRAQFAFTYAEALLPERANGSPVVSVATVLTTNTSSFVAPADRGITRPRDLAGKTYATFGGPIEKPLLEALVRCDGGDPSTIDYVDAGNADYAAGFRRKLYDFTWVFDGWDVIRLRDLQKTPLTRIALRDHSDCIPDWYTPILATTEAVAASDPDLVRGFLSATAAGYAAAAKDPGRAAATLLSAVPESDRPLVEASATFLAPYFAGPQGWGQQDPAVWARFDRFLRDHRIVTGGPPVATAFTNAFLPGGA